MILNLFKKLSIVLISTLLLYFGIAFLLESFPKKYEAPQDKKENAVYLLYNSMHSDIVFNIKDLTLNWYEILPLITKESNGYLSFGWGEKEIYMNTPTWEEVNLPTVINALFKNTSSILHVNYYQELRGFEGVKKINVSKAQLKVLETKIFKHFKQPLQSYKGYGAYDMFYDAKFKYNFIQTCNTWTGRQLRESNITMSAWTPLVSNVVNSLP